MLPRRFMLLVRAALIGAAFFGALLLSWPASARAYVPSAQDLFTQLSLQVPLISRAIIDLRVLVFDPAPKQGDLPAEGEGSVEPEPVEQPERGFRQRLYWIRDQLAAVETFSNSGELLHVYVNEGLAEGAVNLGTRHFETLDVLHPFLPFMGGRPDDWRQGLAQWGIQPWRVGLRPGYKLHNLYRVGMPGAPAAYLDPARLALVSLETRILTDGAPLRLSVNFSEAVLLGENLKREEQLYFPRVASFFLNARLFKQVRVVRAQADPPLTAFPVARLRDQARPAAHTLSLYGTP
jgi:hypothetical protein